jgi:hypothetical protein
LINIGAIDQSGPSIDQLIIRLTLPTHKSESISTKKATSRAIAVFAISHASTASSTLQEESIKALNALIIGAYQTVISTAGYAGISSLSVIALVGTDTGNSVET